MNNEIKKEKLNKGMKRCPHCQNEIPIRSQTCKICNGKIEPKKKVIKELESNIDLKKFITSEKDSKSDEDIIQEKKGFIRKNKPRIIKGNYIHYLENNPVYPIKIILNWKISHDYFSTFLKNNKMDYNKIYKETYREYFIKITDTSVTDEQLDTYLSSFNPELLFEIKPEELTQKIKNQFTINDCYWNWIYDSDIYCKWLTRLPNTRISLKEIGLLGFNWAVKNCGKDILEFHAKSNYFK